MELSELQMLVKTRSFKSTVCGNIFKFLSGELLEFNSVLSEHYCIKEQNNWLVMEPNHLLGNQALIMKVEELKYPVTITLYKRSNLDFFTTFIEE